MGSLNQYPATDFNNKNDSYQQSTNEESYVVEDTELHKSEIDDLQTTCSALEMLLKTHIKRVIEEKEALRAEKRDGDALNESLKAEVAKLKIDLKKARRERIEAFKNVNEDFMDIHDYRNGVIVS